MSKLISGKNNIQGIVSIQDHEDGFVTLYIQDNAGRIFPEVIPRDYWILTHKQTDKHCIKLSGNGYYQYLNPFSTNDDFQFAKKHFRKFGDQAWWVNDSKESLMLSNGLTYYKGLKQKDVSVLAFDIETTTLEHNKDAKILIIANTFRDSSGNIERKLFCYDDFSGPKEMLEAWCDWVRNKNPSIITGHNIYSFDFGYLDFIASTVNIELRLGRQGEAIKFNSWSSKFRKDATQFIDYFKCHIPGREIVDTFFLSIKYDVSRKYNSYRLKSIIEQEGLEVEGRQFYDASLIRKNYTIPSEWKQIKAYAEFDADDAMALWDLQGPSVFYWCQKVPKSLQEIVCGATGSQLNAMMVRSYLQEWHSLPRASETKRFEGAISQGFPGIYNHALKFDIASLYPSIILQYEIFDREKDPKGNFFEIVKTLREYRLENKRKAKETGERYYTDLEQSEKVGINSAYGFLGSVGLLFNSPGNAAKVTEYGRDILTSAINWTKEKNFTLINCDTDAVSFTANRDFSQQEQTDLLNELNSRFPTHIKFEPDGYFPKIIVLAAKNYIMFDGKKIKTKGSSLRDQKKEAAIREFLDRAIEILVHNNQPNTQLVELYYSYIAEAMDLRDIKRWCSKKTITKAVMTSPRTNETKVKDAIKNSEYVEADKVWLFFKNDNSLCLAENFDGDYNKMKLVEKLYKVTLVFESILPVKELFKNYSLKRNAKELASL